MLFTILVSNGFKNIDIPQYNYIFLDVFIRKKLDVFLKINTFTVL